MFFIRLYLLFNIESSVWKVKWMNNMNSKRSASLGNWIEILFWSKIQSEFRTLKYNSIESSLDNETTYSGNRVSNNRTASIKSTLWKSQLHMACKDGQFDVVELMLNDQFMTFSINLNDQHVNGMTPYYLAVHM